MLTEAGKTASVQTQAIKPIRQEEAISPKQTYKIKLMFAVHIGAKTLIFRAMSCVMKLNLKYLALTSIVTFREEERRSEI